MHQIIVTAEAAVIGLRAAVMLGALPLFVVLAFTLSLGFVALEKVRIPPKHERRQEIRPRLTGKARKRVKRWAKRHGLGSISSRI